MTDTLEAYILSDEGKTTLVVIAGCGFAPGDEVLIRSGFRFCCFLQLL